MTDIAELDEEFFEATWNAQADKYNQWPELDCDEKIAWVLSEVKRLAEYLANMRGGAASQ